MKRIIIIPLILMGGVLSAKNYYVSITGNDNNNGSIESPWYTMSKAYQNGLSPNDTVFLRGGIYYYTSFYGNQIQNTNGTSDAPIVIINYPGEKVVWDYSKQIHDYYNYGLRVWNCDHLKIKGIEIRNIKYGSPNLLITGVDVRNCNHVIIENISVHNTDGIGFYAVTNDYLQYINCDSYDNIFGGEGDGWQISSNGYRGSVYLKGCRSWHNSDDAWDCAWNDGIVEFDSCWAMSCGYDDGDGNGFKMGIGALSLPALDIPQRVARNCIAAFNSYHGFTQNSADFRISYYNCAAFKNGWDPRPGINGAGFGTFGNNQDFEIYRNCIAYDNFDNEIWGDFNLNDDQYNSWNSQTGVTLTNEDFVLVDSTLAINQLMAPRKPDGSLPDIEFLKLVSKSDLIDAGVDIGLPFNGNAPDLGWSEYSSSAVPLSPPNPVYVSSVIQNSSPSRLEMTYNLTLANIIPATSAFNVRVNNVTRSINSVAISGTKVLLTLSTPVIYGNDVTVSYTKPASNPLQTENGGQAASMIAQIVTNNVSASNQPPVVNISSPTKSTSFIAPATVTINATASDTDGSVSKVEFFNGTAKLGETSSLPYSYTWKEVPTGTYYITAVATDNEGLRATSSPVTIVVEKSTTVVNLLPTVSIKTLNHNKIKKHDNIFIVADATDPDGSITMVELKNRDVTIAQLTKAPYTYTLQDADTGTYFITAVATDNFGASSTSELLELIIEDYDTPIPDLIRIYPNPNQGVFKLEITQDLPFQQRYISIVNITGQIVYQEKLADGKNYSEVSLTDLQPGTYVLMMNYGNEIVGTKKFIKQ